MLFTSYLSLDVRGEIRGNDDRIDLADKLMVLLMGE